MQPVWEAAGARQSRAALCSSLITVFSPLSSHHEGMSSHRRLIPFLAPFFLGTGWVKTQPPKAAQAKPQVFTFCALVPSWVCARRRFRVLCNVLRHGRFGPFPLPFFLGTGG